MAHESGDPRRERVLLIETDDLSRGRLANLLLQAGYEVTSAPTWQQAFESFRNQDIDILLLDAALSGMDSGQAVSELKGAAATAKIRVILLSGADPAERSRGLDLGADDVIARPWDEGELLARVRVQLRARRAEDSLRKKTRLAEEGQEIAHTAFEVLAVTEKMTRDAFSLSRRLRIGLAALFVVAGIMAATYFFFFRRAEKETARAYATIARLERNITSQENLLARAREMRGQVERSAEAGMEDERKKLQEQSEQLRQQMAKADSDQVAALRRELQQNNLRLQQLENDRQSAQTIIRNYANSVALMHVSVAFRHRESGRRLRYEGLDAEGEPLTDNTGQPRFTLEGRGPEVRADFFGTGFLVREDGRMLTNRHVVEPWWKNEELTALEQQGVEAVIAEISAYFPEAPGRTKVEIQKIAPDADVAVVQAELGALKRPVLQFDARREAAVSGQPVISLGYAAGLAAILARGGDDTVNEIVRTANGDARQIVGELQRRKMIRPIATHGLIGDVSSDKIVFDAQTTSGGSGGPLFNRDGKVIGITFAVVRGFGGSNFGIPIQYALPLL